MSKLTDIQTLLGVTPDGIWGPRSQAALDGLIHPAATEEPIPSLAGLQHNDWPREADAQAFFGYPPNLTQVDLPFPMHLFSADGELTHRISCNPKVAASLRRIFAAILAHYGSPETIHATGVDIFDGVYNDRNVRGANHKSMHAFGAAIDIDAEHNPLGATSGRMPSAVVEIFKAEGWRWGGDYTGRKDWMHFEACV